MPGIYVFPNQLGVVLLGQHPLTRFHCMRVRSSSHSPVLYAHVLTRMLLSYTCMCMREFETIPTSPNAD